MKLAQLIDLETGHRIQRHNRLLSNWFATRSKILGRGEAVVTHRISESRVVLDVLDNAVQSAPRASRAVGWFVFSVALFLAIAGLGSVLVSHFNQGPRVRANETTQTQPSCKQLSVTNLEVGDLSAFNVDGWSIASGQNLVRIGQFAKSEFVARCKDLVERGSLIAKQSSKSWQIKRMVPID